VGSLRQHFYRGLFGLQFKTTLLLTVIVMFATGLTGATHLRLTSRLTLVEAKRHARELARGLASAAAEHVTAGNREALLKIAEGMMPEGDLTYLIFTDMTGKLLASYQKAPGNINHLVHEDVGEVSVEPINQPRFSTKGSSGSHIDIVFPVRVSQLAAASSTGMAGQGRRAPGLDTDRGKSTATVGYVRLGVGLAASESRLNALIRNETGLTVGIALLMVPLGYEVVRRLMRPIQRLSSAVRSFAAGVLSTRVKSDRRDEIGELSTAFDAMADNLVRSHEELSQLNTELEERVRQRTMALEDANSQLREMASRDSLTGLFNRRHFNDLLSQLFAEASRYGTELTCMMIDLDNFKRVNDSLGHQMGDQLLQLTARVIRDSIREADVAVRFGGDEFAVLLPQTSPQDARVSAERILEDFGAEVRRHLPQASIASLSIGLASCRHGEPAAAKDLVNLADEALYLAKAGGKNRITVVCPPPVHA
jgi:diguanylate cyclase (GGDEF)-like protein